MNKENAFSCEDTHTRRPDDAAIIVLAHGSSDPQWREPIDAVVRAIRQRQPGRLCVCAFIQHTAPLLGDAVVTLLAEAACQKREVAHIRIVPLFLGLGLHVRQDLPELLAQMQTAHPGVVFSMQAAVSEDARLIDTLATIALEPLVARR